MKRKKYASGGSTRQMSNEEFLDSYEQSKPSGRMQQEAYYAVNPEPGLEDVRPEEMMLPTGTSKAGSNILSKILPHQKAGAYRNPKAKREADEAMRERIKAADAKKDKLRFDTEFGAFGGRERSKWRGPYEPRRQSDQLTMSAKDIDKRIKPTYRKGGEVKSSASKRADGCAIRGKTKGRIV